ncbi:MAG: ATP-binding protein [Saprospiraceae bacterium]
MQRSLLFIAIGLLFAIGAGVKWISGTMVEGLSVPGEVPGEISVFKERTGAAAPLRAAEVNRLPDSLFAIRENCCEFGTPQGPIWLRFKVRNDSTLTHFDKTKTHFLTEIVNPFLPRISYFNLNEAGLLRDSFTTGSRGFAFHQRPDTNSRNFRFPLALPADSTAVVLLRIESDAPLQLRVLFFEQGERLGHQQWTVDILLTIFFVFCTLFLVLSGILIAVSREHFNWHYFFYILVTTLFIQAHLGLGFKYVWCEYPALQHIVPMALNTLRLIFGIQFFRLYFDLPRTAPRFDRFVRGSVLALFATLVLQITAQSFGNFQWVLYPFFVFLMLFCVTMLVWVLYEMLFKRRTRFSFLFLVVGLNFVGVAATSFQYLGYSPSFFDITDDLLTAFGIANTFFVPPFVIAAFFLEMVLVFYFSVRRFLRLIEKNQRAELRLARAKEEGLNALVMGAENERKRIARDLHDGACVNLAAINLKMDMLREQLADSPALAERALDIADDLDATYRELRGISHDLMSKALEKTGLPAALEELTVRARQAQPGLDVQLFVNYPLDDLSSLDKIHLYRMVQELLGNVLKHAQARHVNIQLLNNEGNLLLTVEDDGQGFDPQKMESDGIGLSNIRTRAEVLRAKMHLDAAPGKGTFVSIEIPRPGSG